MHNHCKFSNDKWIKMTIEGIWRFGNESLLMMTGKIKRKRGEKAIKCIDHARKPLKTHADSSRLYLREKE